MKPGIWQVRAYRTRSEGLLSFCAAAAETEISFLSDKDLRHEALELILKYRRQIESHIVMLPEFMRSLSPLPDDENAPPIIRDMIKYSAVCGVGPMAGVAGAVAEYVSRGLLAQTSEIIAENGGDIFMSSSSDRVVAVDFDKSAPPLQLKISAADMPLGVATSSGIRGHSLSFGSADSVTVTAKSAILADCAATALANIVARADDIPKALNASEDLRDVAGVVVICGGSIGVRGDIELI